VRKFRNLPLIRDLEQSSHANRHQQPNSWPMRLLTNHRLLAWRLVITKVSSRSWQGALKTRSMPEKLNAGTAAIGIDIGKNSFHIVGLDQRDGFYCC
jgi:hypothetical protein